MHPVTFMTVICRISPSLLHSLAVGHQSIAMSLEGTSFQAFQGVIVAGSQYNKKLTF
jgi:hypothetical protein